MRFADPERVTDVKRAPRYRARKRQQAVTILPTDCCAGAVTPAAAVTPGVTLLAGNGCLSVACEKRVV